MPSPALDVRTLTAAARVAAVGDAARVLDSGGVAVIPGDTGYLVCASGRHAAGVEIGRGATRSPAPGWPECAVWLAPDVGAIHGAMPELTSVQRKVIRVLAPGPAVFAVSIEEDALARLRSALGVAPGVIDDGRAAVIRVCGPSIGATIAARVQPPLVSWEPADDRARSMLDAGRARDAAMAVGIDPALVLDDGPPPPAARGPARRSLPSTDPAACACSRRVRMNPGYVAKHAHLNILFVCTGNTCRSPMAEAIATGLTSRDKARPGAPLRFESAGVGAMGGAPRTREGLEAVRALGLKAGQGSSRPLTRQLLADADLIYAMTRSHLAGILSLDPAAGEKAALLDPAGGDIPDPIGLSQEAYNETARRLERLIAERLKEWRS